MKVKIDEPQPPAHRSIQSCPKGEWWQGAKLPHIAYCRVYSGVVWYDKKDKKWGILGDDADRQVSRCICESLELEWD